MTKIISFFGKKQSGKGSCATLISALTLTSYRVINDFTILDNHYILINNEPVHINDINPNVVKIYSFADALKYICRDVFEVDASLVFGTDEQKEQHTHLRWEEMPGVCTDMKLMRALKKTCAKQKKLYDTTPNLNLIYHEPGFMTGRQLLQYFGSDICRKIYDECWGNYLFSQIKKESPIFACIADARFKTEHKKCQQNKCFNVWLKRDKFKSKDAHVSENELNDSMSFDVILDNDDWTLKQTFQELIDKMRPTNILAPI